MLFVYINSTVIYKTKLLIYEENMSYWFTSVSSTQCMHGYPLPRSFFRRKGTAIYFHGLILIQINFIFCSFSKTSHNFSKI